ncbi:TPA: hypothetical protein EYG96_00445 [Candidatus Gracilibacteria bacterium]|nr:hypothetical protein [Candidatus Peregrinibacteria bacterium]HIQ56498.1 hypothetical protein [Candidatus Gracilibacteria bacterium]HIQ57292.1 hypothetical protein [Candidatus Gracilibacteria bacterium]
MEFVDSGLFWAFLGACIAAVAGAVGSAIGSGIVGQAATGLASEKPELGMKAIILEALPGSQVIYGFVGLFFIVYVVLPKYEVLTAIQGIQILFASIPVAISGVVSGFYQGKVLAGSMAMLAKDEGSFANAMIMGAIVETVAVLGLLGTILMLLKV